MVLGDNGMDFHKDENSTELAGLGCSHAICIEVIP